MQPKLLANPRSLDPEQTTAVEVDGPLVLCVAGAGTGKTRALTHRIERLVREGTSARTILAITFTRKAAGELSERLADLLPEREVRKMRIGTFHSLALDVVRAFGELAGYRKNLSIYDEQDRQDVLRAIITDHGMKGVSVKKAVEYISEVALGGVESDPQLNLLALEYQNTLRRFNALDYDLLMMLAVQLLDIPRVQEHYHALYRVLCVDEFQDSDLNQMAFIDRLDPEQMFAVGDYRQSIYGWRGAQPDLLITMAEIAGTARVDLVRNYRSRPEIVSLANVVIPEDKGQFGKDLIPTRRSEGGPEVTARVFPDMVSEGEFIVNTVIGMCDSGAVKDEYTYRDIVVLARTNRILAEFSQWLRDSGYGDDFPHIRIGAQGDFWKCEEVRLCVQALKILFNPDDNHSLKMLLKGLDCQEPEMRRLEAQARKGGLPLVKLLSPGNPVRLAFEHCETITAIPEQPAYLMFMSFCAALDLREHWLERMLTTRAANVEKLNSILKERLWTLAEFIEWYGLRDIQDDLAEVEDKNRIRLMTVHAAKGLEFPIVFLMDVADGQFPNHRSDQAEERRLFYVACTRARERLYLTCSTTDGYGKTRAPSQYLGLTQPTLALREG